MDTWLKREGKTPLFIFFRPLAIGEQKSILPVRVCVCVHGKRALPYLTHGLERHAYATPPWVQNLWVGEIERSSESRQPMRSMRSRSPDRVPHGFDDGVLPLPSRCIAIGHHHNEPNQGQIRPGTKGKKPTNHTDGQNPPPVPGTRTCCFVFVPGGLDHVPGTLCCPLADSDGSCEVLGLLGSLMGLAVSGSCLVCVEHRLCFVELSPE